MPHITYQIVALLLDLSRFRSIPLDFTTKDGNEEYEDHYQWVDI